MSQVLLFLIMSFSILSVSAYLIWRWSKHYISPHKQAPGPSEAIADSQLDPKSSCGVLVLPPQPSGQRSFSAFDRLDLVFFIAAIIIYLVTRFDSLPLFPITFFGDEAAQTAIAASLVQNGFSYDGEFLPTYFLNVDKYSLSVTVYMQILPYLLFGKSILVTRGTSVLVGLIGIVAVSLTLKRIFRIPYWWSGVLLLAISPGWFMHSRTAFETATATSLYALFLFNYLLYLYRSPKYFALFLIAGALTYYSYNPARLIILATVVFFGLSDFRYHWENRRLILGYWWLILLITLPYIRFQITHPFAGIDQLFLINSYWIQDIPLYRKILMFGNEIVRGLNPLYWFFPNQQDLIRHVMKGYGHLLWVTLPFALLGLYIAFKRIRISAYRVLLIALVCSLFGAAIVEISITRALPFIIPVTLLTAIGLSASLERFSRSRKAYIAASIGMWIAMSSVSLYITNDALTHGATWFKNYGLYGMQYGSPQIFEEIKAIIKKSPDTTIILTPFWANGTSMHMRFFMDDLRQLRWGVIGDYLAVDYPIDEEDIFIMIPHEYDIALASDQVKDIRVRSIVYYPDGNPGFYFVNVELVENNE